MADDKPLVSSHMINPCEDPVTLDAIQLLLWAVTGQFIFGSFWNMIGASPNLTLAPSYENPARKPNRIKPPNLRSDRAAELGAGLESTKNGGGVEYEEEEDQYPSLFPP